MDYRIYIQLMVCRGLSKILHTCKHTHTHTHTHNTHTHTHITLHHTYITHNITHYNDDLILNKHLKLPKYADTKRFFQILDIKQEFSFPGCVKKSFWIILTLFLIGVWLWNSHDVLASFLRYDVTVSYDIRLAHEVEFPAVTICNQNVARSSKLNNDPSGKDILDKPPTDLCRNHFSNINIQEYEGVLFCMHKTLSRLCSFVPE